MPRRKYEYPGDDPMLRLVHYYMGASIMRGHFLELWDEYEGRWEEFERENSYHFCTYLGYWLAALFVVVEGFNKLRIKAPRVQRLFNEHLHDLKAMRHEMFHYTPRVQAHGHEVISKLNWASELHDAIGAHLQEHASREVRKKRLAAKRNRKRRAAYRAAKEQHKHSSQ